MEDSQSKYLFENNFKKRDIKFKNILIVVMIGVTIITSWSLYSKNTTYSVFLNKRLIGYTDNKRVMRSNIKAILKEIRSEFQQVEISKPKLTFKREGETFKVHTNLANIKKDILKALNGTVSANALFINGNNLGYISSIVDSNNIIDLISKMYLNDMNIENGNITSIYVDSNIELREEIVHVKNVESLESIVKSIYDKSKDGGNLLNVMITLENNEIQEITPKTTIIPSEDLYLGESTNQEGVPGEKEVIKKVTYVNGEKIEEKKLSEKVITESKDNILYSGVKSPISKGVAFLEPPSRGVVTSNFGPRWGGSHRGMDIAGNIGDPIVAAFMGNVKKIDYSSIYGNYIVINHGGGIETLYAHCSKIIAKVGQEVKKGELIANIGNTGRSTGPHLHFELIVNGSAVNPANYIQ